MGISQEEFINFLKDPDVRQAIVEIVIDAYKRNSSGIRDLLDQSSWRDQEHRC
jgi:hypothetical protein